MSRSRTERLLNDGWEDVLAWLPPNLDKLATSTGGIRRRRAIRSGEDLLRLALAYAVLDLSLRSVAGWAATHGLAELSDVAVLKRLKGARSFLHAVLGWLVGLSVGSVAAAELPLRVKLVDATTVSFPGSTGTNWRLHAGWDPVAQRLVDIELTDAHGGEHLDRFGLGEGDLVVADRGYAHAHHIIDARERGAHVLVRIGHSAVPLRLPGTEERLDPLAFAMRRRDRPGRPPRVEECTAEIVDKSGRRCFARLIVIRKSAEARDKDRQRLRREASKKGRQPTRRTLDAAAYSLLLTTVPPETADARTLAELYRVRWQVELAFKRMKSLLHLGELRARDPALAQTYILAKLIAVCLADSIAGAARSFSPWGVPLRPITTQPVAALPMGR